MGCLFSPQKTVVLTFFMVEILDKDLNISVWYDVHVPQSTMKARFSLMFWQAGGISYSIASRIRSGFHGESPGTQLSRWKNHSLFKNPHPNSKPILEDGVKDTLMCQFFPLSPEEPCQPAIDSWSSCSAKATKGAAAPGRWRGCIWDMIFTAVGFIRCMECGIIGYVGICKKQKYYSLPLLCSLTNNNWMVQTSSVETPPPEMQTASCQEMKSEFLWNEWLLIAQGTTLKCPLELQEGWLATVSSSWENPFVFSLLWWLELQ